MWITFGFELQNFCPVSTSMFSSFTEWGITAAEIIVSKILYMHLRYSADLSSCSKKRRIEDCLSCFSISWFTIHLFSMHQKGYFRSKYLQPVSFSATATHTEAQSSWWHYSSSIKENWSRWYGLLEKWSVTAWKHPYRVQVKFLIVPINEKLSIMWTLSGAQNYRFGRFCQKMNY